MLSVKLIVNPNAGKIRNHFVSLNKLTQKLNRKSILPEIIYTTPDMSDENRIMHNLLHRDAVIVCGGDGTLNKVITYMIKNNIYKPILLIPGGTANVFYLEKNLTSDLDQSIHTLLNGKKTPTDIGVVQHKKGINYFLLMVGIGLDAKAINEVDPNVKRLLGKSTYLFSGVKNFITYKPKQIHIQYGEKDLKHIHTVIISNSRLYGGNIDLFPEANMHDGLLDLCAFVPENNVALLRSLVDIQFGRHIESPDLVYDKLEEAYIQSEENKKIPFQLDGEAIGNLPIKVSILKHRIDFILP
ncbi:diacylglycerol/lipid kinase family protein [bacterium]